MAKAFLALAATPLHIILAFQTARIMEFMFTINLYLHFQSMRAIHLNRQSSRRK